MTDLDIRQQMYKDQMDALEQDMIPFGIIDGGIEDESFVDSTGQAWEIAENQRIEDENRRMKEWEKKFDEEQRLKEEELIRKFYKVLDWLSII